MDDLEKGDEESPATNLPKEEVSNRKITPAFYSFWFSICSIQINFHPLKAIKCGKKNFIVFNALHRKISTELIFQD